MAEHETKRQRRDREDAYVGAIMRERDEARDTIRRLEEERDEAVKLMYQAASERDALVREKWGWQDAAQKWMADADTLAALAVELRRGLSLAEAALRSEGYIVEADNLVDGPLSPNVGAAPITALTPEERAREWAMKVRARYGVIADRTASDPIGPVPETDEEIAARLILEQAATIEELLTRLEAAEGALNTFSGGRPSINVAMISFDSYSKWRALSEETGNG